MGQVIETDGSGRLVIPAELLGSVQPHSRYVVKTVGAKLLVEAEAVTKQRQKAYEEWKQGWDELAEEIGKVWPAGLSAVDAIAEQRR